MSEKRDKPFGYVVLSSDVRVGTAGRIGVGIDSLPREEAARLRPLAAAMELGRSLRTSRFVKAIGVGGEVVASGVIVAVLTLEIYEAGGRGTLRLRSVQDAPAPAGSFVATIALDDDADTPYEVVAGPWHVGPMAGRAEFFFRPRPPATSSELRISIVRLDPWQPPASAIRPPWRPTAAIEGPWGFRARL